MKVILLGNAGAGKSTLSRKLMAESPAACLSLDAVAFNGGIERRPLQDTIADVKQFIERKDIAPLPRTKKTLLLSNPQSLCPVMLAPTIYFSFVC